MPDRGRSRGRTPDRGREEPDERAEPATEAFDAEHRPAAGARGGLRPPTVVRSPRQPETTGRFIVAFREDAVDEGVRALRDSAGVRMTAAAEFGAEGDVDAAGTDLVFENIGAGVTTLDPDQVGALSVRALGAPSGILAMEPERINYALELQVPAEEVGFPADVAREYVRGYRDAVDHLADRLLVPGGTMQLPRTDTLVDVAAETDLTWGLQATRADRSRFTGRGIRVAVLDTGFGPQPAPDFTGRNMAARSFIAGQTVADGHGHGTHCIGTSCGPQAPNPLPRYGVAYEADIFVGKVLSNGGSGGDAGILAGIDWAVANGCQIISMSLGAPVLPGEPPSQVYEIVARRALARGTLIIAAAGNESDRRVGEVAPVGRPANSPSIMAVAAIDQSRKVAWFSCGAINPNGGEVNIAGPGVAVISSWPFAPFRRPLNGTSMATPHVAGCAALWAQRSNARGRALWQLLTQHARPLPLPARDVGVGLVQAP